VDTQIHLSVGPTHDGDTNKNLKQKTEIMVEKSRESRLSLKYPDPIPIPKFWVEEEEGRATIKRSKREEQG